VRVVKWMGRRRKSAKPIVAPLTTSRQQAIERRSRDVARNIDRFVRGEPLENIVTTT
jgi:hypothetical protein